MPDEPMRFLAYLIRCIRAYRAQRACRCFKPLPPDQSWIAAFCIHDNMGAVPWTYPRPRERND